MATTQVMRPTRGFSLVELLVVLAIMAVLATVAFPLAELAHKRQREEELRSALREIRTAIDAYKRAADEGRVPRSANGSGYPPSLAALVTGVEDARAGNGTKLYFLRRIPADPFWSGVEAAHGAAVAQRASTLLPQLAGAGTWGLRSYASEPEDPRPGNDVFDIYSLSSEVGLNGRPYRQW
ncbi:type II secretion system protein [Eleftheria terrae]|uniref:type II secretion system protein n=1 Tax=Eleftheria terrae TaxID=1597781 RepID=UPI00263BD502|nr:type II secretion system protein [Eleftheria terrae]WKB56146.1 type II secretion system GspH family protein [Eleftheria terrae]